MTLSLAIKERIEDLLVYNSFDMTLSEFFNDSLFDIENIDDD